MAIVEQNRSTEPKISTTPKKLENTAPRETDRNATGWLDTKVEVTLNL